MAITTYYELSVEDYLLDIQEYHHYPHRFGGTGDGVTDDSAVLSALFEKIDKYYPKREYLFEYSLDESSD